MKKIISSVGLASMLLIIPQIASADKPSWAGQGKPSKEYKEEMKYQEKIQKERSKDEMEYRREMMKKEKEEAKEKFKKEKERGKSESHRQDIYNKHKNEDVNKEYRTERDDRNVPYGTRYEGQGQTDKEFIEQKKDETKKNWISKVFDFLN